MNITDRETTKRQLKKEIRQAQYQIYTILRHISQSGMSRDIDCYVIIKNTPYCISYDVAQILGMNRAKDGSIKISGCGMDMGYHIVNSLSIELYCKGKYTHEGAYKLKHRWI